MIIDCHVHCPVDEAQVDKLMQEADRLKIDKLCLLGNHAGIRYAMKRYPEKTIAMGHLRLGHDNEALVDDFRLQGFKGLKVIRPMANYDDKAYYPVYERACANRMPILFHTGIVSRSASDHYRDVSVDRMRPMYLDTIARRFQDLDLIMAHFGNPWYEEAGEVIRMNANVYVDLTGSTLKKKKPAYFKELLWWDRTQQYKGPGGKGPWEKVLFGTDVSIAMMEDVMNDYRKLVKGCKLTKKQSDDVMGKTAARIFGFVR